MLLSLLALTIAAGAQTLNVQVDNVTYQFPSSLTGDMTYSGGTTLTIMGKVFTISDITDMTVDSSTPTDNTVTVTYGDAPTVTVVGNAARYVDVAIDGTQVAITQTSTTDDNAGEITYTLSGSASGSYDNGLFYMSGEYKSTVEFNGLTLTNTAGPAVCIYNGKRIEISSKKGTENTLTGLGTKTYKGCLYVKGHSEFKGKGSLIVNCSDYHGIKSNEYMTLKNCDLTVNMSGSSSNLKDGIHISEYFLMESGSITVTGISTSDDAIQVELDGTTSTGEFTDHEDEDSGNVYITGGTLTATAAGTATKCLKADGDIFITGGTLTLNANGAIDVSDLTDISYTSGLKAGGNITIDGGTIVATVTGGAGRGINADGTITINDGNITVNNSGATNSSGSSYYCTAKGIKAGEIVINGGTVDVTMSGNASKGIKADEDDGSGNMTITGGTITVTTTGNGAYDGTESDAKGCGGLKADKDMTISGGTLTLKSSGSGGKCIKADGTLTISDDANIYASATGSKYTYSSNVTSSPKAIKAGTRTEKESASTVIASAPGGGGGGNPGGGGGGNPGGGPGGGGSTVEYTYTGGIVITGGTVVAYSTNHEAIESKSTIDISGGYIYANAGDDGINAASTFNITGGNVYAYSKSNDGMDANGNFNISGGNVVAIAARTPEVGIDANTEDNYKLTITGGNIVAIGGLENGSTVNINRKTASFSQNKWYTFKNGSNSVFSFYVPTNSNMGTTMTICASSTPSTTALSAAPSGTSIWDGNGVIGN